MHELRLADFRYNRKLNEKLWISKLQHEFSVHYCCFKYISNCHYINTIYVGISAASNKDQKLILSQQ